MLEVSVWGKAQSDVPILRLFLSITCHWTVQHQQPNPSQTTLHGRSWQTDTQTVQASPGLPGCFQHWSSALNSTTSFQNAHQINRKTLAWWLWPWPMLFISLYVYWPGPGYKTYNTQQCRPTWHVTLTVCWYVPDKKDCHVNSLFITFWPDGQLIILCPPVMLTYM